MCELKRPKIRLCCISVMSHPTWVCELKHQYSEMNQMNQESHPTWVCELKRMANANVKKAEAVTPYMGV